ncbi:nucleotidyltransferase family protein [Dinoroseobacter sp. S76]|uniref:nucleotidyltransferase family protein n=1 Tax=Dinoroseobacter sp. S76 TaxID=3415124 RepID=UPI003C7D9C59
MPDAVMLFAAGRGTRMAPLTDHLPKPLVEVAGRPLLDHALELVTAARIDHCVVNTHYRAVQIAEHLATRPEILISEEPEERLETGGGLRAALPLLGPGPVFTLNSDAVWSDPTALSQLRATWDPTRMDALLLLIPAEHAHGHRGAGDFTCAADGRLTRSGPLTYTGAQILKPDGLADIPDRVFSLNLLWDQMAARGRLCGLVYSGHWADVGTPSGIEIAETMLAAHQ